MDVILDTNIYRQDLSANSSKFAVLLDYITKTNSEILLPKLVRDELAGLLVREIREREKRIAGARADIARMLPHRPQPAPTDYLDVEAEVASYVGYLLHKLSIRPSSILDHRSEYLADVIARAIARRRPCSDAGEEFRDAVLWLTVLDAATDRPSRTVAFVSSNKKQFAEADRLHPDLQLECKARNVTVHYFASLDDFHRQHAIRLSFATADWLAEELDPTSVVERAEDAIIDIGERLVDRDLAAGEQIDGPGRLKSGDLEPPVIYVYEMGDGSYRLDVSYAGCFGVTFPISTENWYPVDSGYAPFTDHGDRTVDVECHVRVDAEVHEQRIVDWSIESVERM